MHLNNVVYLKKKKNLDFSIFSDKERTQIVKNITDTKEHIILLSVLKSVLSDSSIVLFKCFFFTYFFVTFLEANWKI